MITPSSQIPVNSAILFGNLTLVKASQAVQDTNNSAMQIDEIWKDQYGNPWTPSLAFIQGTGNVPEFIRLEIKPEEAASVTVEPVIPEPEVSTTPSESTATSTEI